MVYESDFYTVRRPYTTRITPTISSYTVTTPRYYSVTERPGQPRHAEQNYSYSYTNESTTRDGRGPARSYTTTERVARESRPGYSSTSEYSRSSGDGPGGYHASYSSTTSGRLPYGTPYNRHYSYRV